MVSYNEFNLRKAEMKFRCYSLTPSVIEMYSKEWNHLLHNLYREYKKISDIKLRSNLVADHLNGKYCPREIPKKDQERYKPSKIFKTMYQKNHAGESRNGEESGHHHTE